MSLATARAPVNLVSVNTAPDRAKVVIGKVIENVKDKYEIVHAGNTTSELALSFSCKVDRARSLLIRGIFSAIEGVKPLLMSVQPPPGILVSPDFLCWRIRLLMSLASIVLRFHGSSHVPVLANVDF